MAFCVLNPHKLNDVLLAELDIGKTSHALQDIDKPLSLPDGEGVLLKNPIDIVLDSSCSRKFKWRECRVPCSVL